MVTKRIMGTHVWLLFASCVAVTLAQTLPPVRTHGTRSRFVLVNGKLVRQPLPGEGGGVPFPNPNPTPTPSPAPNGNSGQDVNRPPSGSETDVNPQSFLEAFANNSLTDRAEAGLQDNVTQEEITNLTSQISDETTNNAIISGETSLITFETDQKLFSGGGPGNDSESAVFQPHLLTSPEAAAIGRSSQKFLSASKQLKTELRISRTDAKVLRAASLPNIKKALDCVFDEPIVCDTSSKYRTYDGSCNNMANPIFGKTNTPFERFLPAKYEDGFGEMKKTGEGSGTPLPNARFISTSFHQASETFHRQLGVAQFTMSYGQFVSHDVNMNTISRGANGAFLRCCNTDGTVTVNPRLIDLGCHPIEILPNDPFFSQFGRRCLSFIRAMGGTDLKCSLGGREQINQVTHYLDGSVVYGSNEQTARNLRTFTYGLLNSSIGPDGRELMLQNPGSAGGFSCPSNAGSNHHCFITGDVRANQNVPLILIHTVFLREHNRVARELLSLNPQWDDETLFQEARKIVIAEFQHITYNEYLRVLVSAPVARFFGLRPQRSGYFTGYSELVNPAIRNSFMAAAYRAHSTVDDLMAPGFPLKGNFNNPTGIYTPGMDNFIQGMSRLSQQAQDRLNSRTMSNHLFESPGRPGSGFDLMATNIQRGRDHGLPSYNDFREFCGLRRAAFFVTGFLGLQHHRRDDVLRLSRIYRHVDDIDPWTGMTSEIPLRGGVFGPTAACIVSLQFNLLKRGDRHFYESDDPHVRFTPEQLDSIRSVTWASLLCANSGQSTVAKDAFRNPFTSNQVVSCQSLPHINLNFWRQRNCVDGGWGPWLGWTPCNNGNSFQFRFCNKPLRNECGKDCEGPPFEHRVCTFAGDLFRNLNPNNFRSGGRGGSPSAPAAAPNATNFDRILAAAKEAAPAGVFPGS